MRRRSRATSRVTSALGRPGRAASTRSLPTRPATSSLPHRVTAPSSNSPSARDSARENSSACAGKTSTSTPAPPPSATPSSAPAPVASPPCRPRPSARNAASPPSRLRRLALRAPRLAGTREAAGRRRLGGHRPRLHPPRRPPHRARHPHTALQRAAPPIPPAGDPVPRPEALDRDSLPGTGRRTRRQQGSCWVTPTSVSPRPCTPTSGFASNATPSTSSAARSAGTPKPLLNLIG